MVKRLVKVFRYKQPLVETEKIPSNELIYVLKRVKRRDIIDFLSDELVKSIEENIKYSDFAVTNVPRKRSRAVKYGLDHSKELARAVAKKLDLDYLELLNSKLDVAQKKTHGVDRIKNARFDYRKNAPDIKGKRMLIVDDIVTTGASMGNCAVLLRGLGAKEVVGVSVSVAFKDKYVPFAEETYNSYK
jgi:ComF family protein